MLPEELEGEGERVRELAGLDRGDVIPPAALVVRLPWVVALEWVDSPGWPRAWRIANDNDRDHIYVHRGDSAAARAWRAVSEAVEGRFARRRYPVERPEIKALVSGVTARVVLPAYPLRVAVCAWGLDFPRLAGAFQASQVTVARRVGEVRQVPYAIVSARHHLRCGIPLEVHQLAALVRKGGDRHFRVHALTDTEGPCWAVYPREW